MADSVMALRMIVREVAMASGVHATFMPKPMEGVQGIRDMLLRLLSLRI